MKTTFFSVLTAIILLSGSCELRDSTNNKQVMEAVGQPDVQPYKEPINKKLANYISEAIQDTSLIPSERKIILREMAEYIISRKKSGKPAHLIYICTHNSRRSHLSQIWASTAAKYYGVHENMYTYSGGTEATAFNSRAVAAIERAGFITENPGGENPKYLIKMVEGNSGMICYSKKYSDETHNLNEFAAVMTCSQADRSCPIIPGAMARISLPYNDPKAFDGTDEEVAKYDERCYQIATEMLYAMSIVKEMEQGAF